MGRFLMNLLPSRCGHVAVSATKPPSQPFSYSPRTPLKQLPSPRFNSTCSGNCCNFSLYHSRILHCLSLHHTKLSLSLSHTYTHFKALEFSNTVHITLLVMLRSKMRLRKEICEEKVNFASR